MGHVADIQIVIPRHEAVGGKVFVRSDVQPVTGCVGHAVPISGEAATGDIGRGGSDRR
jgi:hypothetical protein